MDTKSGIAIAMLVSEQFNMYILVTNSKFSEIFCVNKFWS